jgi:hypothetical protein
MVKGQNVGKAESSRFARYEAPPSRSLSPGLRLSRQEKGSQMSNKDHQHAKRGYRVHRLRRSIRALIGPRKKDTTLQREKESRYFGHVWLSRELHQTISFLARVNHCSKMSITDQAVKAGLSRILSDAIRESNRREAALREHGLLVTPTPMARELARWARLRGFDIGKHV